MLKLDTFQRAYIECALWSSMDDDGEPLDSGRDASDVAPKALASMAADCDAFREMVGEALDDIDDEQAGHDFWLTRNRHGAGFWDRGYAPAIDKALTDAAHSFGEVNLYVGDDELIHCD